MLLEHFINKYNIFISLETRCNIGFIRTAEKWYYDNIDFKTFRISSWLTLHSGKRNLLEYLNDTRTIYMKNVTPETVGVVTNYFISVGVVRPVYKFSCRSVVIVVYWLILSSKYLSTKNFGTCY